MVKGWRKSTPCAGPCAGGVLSVWEGSRVLREERCALLMSGPLWREGERGAQPCSALGREECSARGPLRREGSRGAQLRIERGALSHPYAWPHEAGGRSVRR